MKYAPDSNKQFRRLCRAMSAEYRGQVDGMDRPAAPCPYTKRLYRRAWESGHALSIKMAAKPAAGRGATGGSGVPQ